MKKLTQVKIIIVIVTIMLTFYPVFELSRCIIKYDIIGGWQPGWQGAYLADFYAELGFMWFFYLLLPFAVWKLTDMAYRMGKKGESR
jgi:hypothetical protein